MSSKKSIPVLLKQVITGFPVVDENNKITDYHVAKKKNPRNYSRLFRIGFGILIKLYPICLPEKYSFSISIPTVLFCGKFSFCVIRFISDVLLSTELYNFGYFVNRVAQIKFFYQKNSSITQLILPHLSTTDHNNAFYLPKVVA